jgi:pimeloyl-ACP methyl ester carboxylesterase
MGVLAGCGQGGDVAATPTRRPAPLPIATPTTLEQRCKVPVEGALTRFPGPRGMSLSGAVLGEGPDVAVLLHQTASAGLCGGATYAAWLAERGVRAVLVDFCGWGSSQCPGGTGEDWEAQVRIPVEWARAHGAERVTLVGASLGGVVSLAVGQAAGADAVVSLSGPNRYQDLAEAGPAAAGTTVPLLVAAAPGDRDVEPKALRAAVAGSPARSKAYVEVPDGHGWSLLSDGMSVDPVFTPLATTVLGWVRGDYSVR